MRRRGPTMRTRTATAIVVALAGLELAGCGTSSSGPMSAVPSAAPAPTTTDACTLLDADQRHPLDLGPGELEPMDNAMGGKGCVWSNIQATRPGVAYRAQYLAAPSPGGVPSPPIDGLPTAEVRGASIDPKESCVYEVALAPGRTLRAQFTNIGAGLPGIDHQLACQKALAVATAMTSTYLIKG